MSSQTNTSLRKAVDELSQVLNSSLGGNSDCMQAMANIEEMLSSIEDKLNVLPVSDSNEVLSFTPEALVNNF